MKHSPWILTLLLSGLVYAAPPSPPALPAPAPLPGLPTPPLPTPTIIEQQTLRYEDAPLVALANNPRVSVSLAQARQSLYDVGRFEAPTRLQGSTALLGPPLPVGDANAQVRGDYVLSPVRVELRKLIYDGGRMRANIEMAKSTARTAAWKAQSDWLNLHYEVREAYLNSLSTAGNVTLAEEQVTLAQDQLRQTEARYNLGLAPRGDVLSAGLPVTEAELLVQRNKGLAQTAKRLLNQLLGLDIEAPLNLERPRLPEKLPDLDACLTEAYDRRADLRTLEHTLASYRHAVRAAELDNHPYVNLLAGVALQSSPESYIAGFTYRGGFELNWPFADGGRSIHLTKSAKANVEMATAQVAEIKRLIEYEVRDAYGQISIASAGYDTEIKRVTNAKDALRISQAQYKAGMITVYPVRQAQSDLYSAQASQNQAYYDYFLALAKLDRACGRTSNTLLNTPVPKVD